MKLSLLVLSGVLLAMATGCATKYNAPKLIAPVRASVAKAQVSVASAQGHVKNLSVTAAELTAKLPAQTPELHELTVKIQTEAKAADDDLAKTAEELQTAQTVTIPKLEATVGDMSNKLTIIECRYGKLKFGLCTLAAAGAFYLLLQFRGILAFAGPYAWIAFVAGPAAAFALIWKLIDWVL